jgi:hypothetical protein
VSLDSCICGDDAVNDAVSVLSERLLLSPPLLKSITGAMLAAAFDSLFVLLGKKTILLFQSQSNLFVWEIF